MTIGQDFDQTYSLYKDVNSFQPGRCNVFVYLETPVLNPIICFLHIYPSDNSVASITIQKGNRFHLNLLRSQ